jgi:phospholipid/cholesterol/gamma-HCH transport system substrate-binding protein
VPAEGGEQLLMARLSTSVTRALVVGIAAVIGASVLFFVLGGGSDKKITARFASAIGVYTGTPVRILGVNVGTVEAVRPKGDYVEVVMSYDSKYRLPSNVTAVEVANSLVSDRYVQLTPAWHTKQATRVALPDKATIGVNRTGGPAELDDIYAALDKLSVALGPTGANKGGQQSGALSDLLRVSAANLKGNGTALGNSITNLSKAAETLSGHRGDLFSTVKNLEKFTRTLKSSDAQVRKFNQLLAQVAGDLASERSDLGAALHGLTLALDDVSTFVKSNAGKFHRDIVGLRKLTQLLVNEKASLNETLAVAPYALANIIHSYQPDLGALATRGNLVSLTKIDPQKIVCGLLGQATGGLNGVLGRLPVKVGDVLGPACKAATGTSTKKSSSVSGVTVPGVVGGSK